MARFLEEMTKKVRARNIAKGRAEGRAWVKRTSDRVSSCTGIACKEATDDDS